MSFPFDDATKSAIAGRCAAFVRLPGDPAHALKAAAVAITLTDAVGSVRVAAPKGTTVRRVRGPDAEKDRYVIIARAGVGDLTLHH